MVRFDQIGQIRKLLSKAAGIAVLLAGALLAASLCSGAPTDPSQSMNIFQPLSTPAHSILHLSMLVLAITGAIFAIVFSLLAYSVAKFRKRRAALQGRLSQVGLATPPANEINRCSFLAGEIRP